MDVYRRIATYVDGSEVREGDRIRYRQAPGGLLPASGDWRVGVAARMSECAEDPQRRQWAFDNGIDADELVMLGDDGRRYGIVGHIVERL